ncbi:MAG: TIGR02757 family protein [Bacteroidales bacterium]|nr:TIGR02757 family protein [Bacteroidales bacterium]
MPVPTDIIALLRRYADTYETANFLKGDPSWWMHQVEGEANREAMAFVASCLSYGSRKQFMPRIGWLLECAEGDMDQWIRKGAFESNIHCGSRECLYRLYTHDDFNHFLNAYRRLMDSYGTLGAYVEKQACTGLEAVEAICRYFAEQGVAQIVPKNTQSACKRVCMFLRWMVRTHSPVDIGLWSRFIDRRTLIMPMDTHVLQQSQRLGLLSSTTGSMATARRLTAAMAEVFPDDPLRGDFALFGYGVNNQ